MIRKKVGVRDLFFLIDIMIAFFFIPKTPVLARTLDPVLAACPIEHDLNMSDCI